MPLSLSFDKDTYAEGELVTLTVTNSPGERPTPGSEIITVTLSAANGLTGSGMFTITHPPGFYPLLISDSEGGSWALLEDDGSVAIFTRTA